jgi:hypothetical protein
MPELTRFVEGFGLVQGMVLVGYQLKSLKGSEKTITRNREYSYPLTLTFVRTTQEIKTDPQFLLRHFKSLTSAPRTINSEYGNPYLCSITAASIKSASGNTVVITALGHSHRV